MWRNLQSTLKAWKSISKVSAKSALDCRLIAQHEDWFWEEVILSSYCHVSQTTRARLAHKPHARQPRVAGRTQRFYVREMKLGRHDCKDASYSSNPLRRMDKGDFRRYLSLCITPALRKCLIVNKTTTCYYTSHLTK